MGQVARRVGRWLDQGAGSLVGLPGSATNGTVATVTLLPSRRFPTIQDHRSRARPGSSPNIGLESPEEVQNASQQVSIRSSSDRSGHVRPPAESSRRPSLDTGLFSEKIAGTGRKGPAAPSCRSGWTQDMWIPSSRRLHPPWGIVDGERGNWTVMIR
ncbi:hypothetical protein GQ457_10G005560 [Hibiscus cannabinus]